MPNITPLALTRPARRHKQIEMTKTLQQGFVALTSVVVIASILLMVSIGLSLYSVGELQNSFDEVESSRALALAEYCQEKAVYDLTKNSAYQGGETLTPDLAKPEEICNILPVTTYGEPTGTGDTEGIFTLTEKSDWEAGTNSGTDLVSAPGDVKVNSGGGGGPGKLDLLAMYNADNNIITATTDSANRSKAVDGNLATAWAATTSMQTVHSWIIDLGVSTNITYLALTSSASAPLPGMQTIMESADGVVYNPVCSTMVGILATWNITNSSTGCNPPGHAHPFNTRYLKLSIANQSFGMSTTWTVKEFEVYVASLPASSTATQTSKANQMTSPAGGTAIVQYTEFSPSETASQGEIKYRFRKSNWGGSWLGEWSDFKIYTGAPIDLSKIEALMITAKDIIDARYYINVESTLTKSAPTSDPVLHDYTVKYLTQTGADAGPTICKLIRSEGKVTRDDNFYVRRLESNSCSLCPVSLDSWREVGDFN